MDILGNNRVYNGHRRNASSDGGMAKSSNVHNSISLPISKIYKVFKRLEQNKMILVLLTEARRMKAEFLHDWAIIKIPTFIILAMDFVGFLDKAIKELNIDFQFTWFLVLLVLINTASGAVKSAKEGVFSWKRLGTGILDKIWKYGRLMLLVAILKNFPIGGIKNTVFEKVDVLLLVVVMALEGKKALNYILGNNAEEKIKSVWATIIKTKK